jgi:hypothetical protein
MSRIFSNNLVGYYRVMIAEVDCSCHIKGEKHPEAHAKADALFKSLQQPLEDGLFDGTPKTALIYGYPES